MSHFTQLKTEMTDLDRVVRAAKKLGLEAIAADGQPLFAKGFMDLETEALAVIKTGTRYDVGVVKNETGGLELTADWELLGKVGEIDQMTFQNKLQQQYALLSIQDVAQAQGLSVGEAHIAEDGSIEVTVTQW